MNYYPFNVGDYAAHTAHLEPMEDLAYRRLLDAYYLREGPLPADVQATAKLVRMRSMTADVESVLKEFFTLTEAGWVHRRCESEIERMQEKQAKARASAQASVNARLQRRQANAERTLNENATNAERTLTKIETDVELPTPTPTPTPTPEVIITPQAARRASRQKILRPDDVSEQVWSDWKTSRMAKRAEITQTAIDGIRREAAQAGIDFQSALQTMCERGWTGFKATWYLRDVVGTKPGFDSVRQQGQFNAELAKRAIFGEVIDHDAV